jgi:hypothetical protein
MQIGRLFWVTQSDTVYPEYRMKADKYYIDPCNPQVHWWTRMNNGKLEYYIDKHNEAWTPVTGKLSSEFVVEKINAYTQCPID